MLGCPDTPPERAGVVRVLGTAVPTTVPRLHCLLQGPELVLGLLGVGPAPDGGLGEGPARRQAASSHYRLPERVKLLDTDRGPLYDLVQASS